tara:strand:- start:631 stop:816 length:186 start_codon:yes stop_codon:yes gene_type:complete
MNISKCKHISFDWCDWIVVGSKDVHTITHDPFDDTFEAIVNAIVKCEHCGDERELVFHAES